MILTVVLLSYFWVVSGTCQSEEPEERAKAADQLLKANRLVADGLAAYAEKDFSRAAESYRQAFEAGATVPTVPYNAACCFARLGRTDEAFKYLDLSLQNGLHGLDHLKNDPDLESIRSDIRWDDVVRRCEANRERWRKSIGNPDLYDELMKRMTTDQRARMANVPDGVRITQTDQKNITWLTQVIEEHGWPGHSMVGRDGAQAAWLLVQHADRDPAFQRRCLDLLTKAYEKGDATADQIAYLTDRILLAEGKPQVYGTQFRTVMGRPQPHPIENEAEVDQRRAAIGLEPLAVYAEQIRTHYPP